MLFLVGAGNEVFYILYTFLRVFRRKQVAGIRDKAESEAALHVIFDVIGINRGI